MRFEPTSSSGLKKGLNRPAELPDAKVLEPYSNTAYREQAYLVDLKATSAECEKRCSDDNKCLAFTFKKPDSDCFLFDDLIGYASDANADSAIKRQPAK
jgi:hypothetical protein